MDIKSLALIFAVVAVAVAGFLLIQTQVLLQEVSTAVSEIPSTGAAPPQTETPVEASGLTLSALPEEVDGFERQEHHPRVEPLLGGEEFSSLARFVPEDGSEFAGSVNGVGVMFYRFSAPEFVPPGLAIVSLGNELATFGFAGQEIMWFADEATGQSVYFLVIETSLIHVLSVPVDNNAPNQNALEAAALAVIGALLEHNQ